MSKVTPEELLAEDFSYQDVQAVDSILGRFQSTTGFLSALAVALMQYDHSDPEIEAVRQFTKTFAKVEAAVQNGESTDDEPATEREPTLSIRPEQPLPLLREPLSNIELGYLD